MEYVSNRQSRSEYPGEQSLRYVWSILLNANFFSLNMMIYDAAHEAADFPDHQYHTRFLRSRASFQGKFDWLHISSMFSLMIAYTSSWRLLSMAFPSINFMVIWSIISPKLGVGRAICGVHGVKSGIIEWTMMVSILNEVSFTWIDIYAATSQTL